MINDRKILPNKIAHVPTIISFKANNYRQYSVLEHLDQKNQKRSKGKIDFFLCRLSFFQKTKYAEYSKKCSPQAV